MIKKINLDTFFKDVDNNLLDDVIRLHYLLSNNDYKFTGTCYSVTKYDNPSIKAINLDLYTFSCTVNTEENIIQISVDKAAFSTLKAIRITAKI